MVGRADPGALGLRGSHTLQGPSRERRPAQALQAGRPPQQGQGTGRIPRLERRQGLFRFARALVRAVNVREVRLSQRSYSLTTRAGPSIDGAIACRVSMISCAWRTAAW